MEKNLSIACSVNNCEHNNEREHYCTLDKIMVGTHESNPTQKECTDCNSFQLKSECGCGSSCGCK